MTRTWRGQQNKKGIRWRNLPFLSDVFPLPSNTYKESLTFSFLFGAFCLQTALLGLLSAPAAWLGAPSLDLTLCFLS